ncbi:hypothetical protein PROFUN_09631 [Planoprotostelium fungivorum]|uniref:Uncharacterized protein n=1 Tax=Planoprotostelium fungivorum TaxID=1890364 RepID=A0A2P6MNX7_9EUKA|nr:hypothetical protein PROFUN_09631 [Planoprotostelium fungivorum]
MRKSAFFEDSDAGEAPPNGRGEATPEAKGNQSFVRLVSDQCFVVELRPSGHSYGNTVTLQNRGSRKSTPF